ncbi:hypothetical protein HK097_008745 [Rhizophlyctis rosea]|uniref:Ankyrin n=1 Tax=Rhizophlyctis rosea TaxID=64517 RepID=A0AAD5SI00_9FUNG|nr:hypothetical protein HK097_008745 [Rhizophlyctis rosea]
MSFPISTPPRLPSEILLEIAKLTDPETIRTILHASKPFSKLISPKLISDIDASWHYTQKGEKACWIWAAQYAHTRIIEKLLRELRGPRLESELAWIVKQQRMHFCEWALLAAAGRGNVDIVRLLMGQGRRKPASHPNFDSWVSAWPSDPKKQKEILMEMGVETLFNPHDELDFVNAHFGDCALRRAVLKGHSDVVQLFLTVVGESFRRKNDWLLRMAAKLGRTNVVRVLLEAGADVHSCGDEALLNAATAGHAHTVVALLEDGADLSANNYRAHRSARRCGQWRVVYLLEELTMRRPIDVVRQRGWGAVIREVEEVAWLVLVQNMQHGCWTDACFTHLARMGMRWLSGRQDE